MCVETWLHLPPSEFTHSGVKSRAPVSPSPRSQLPGQGFHQHTLPRAGGGRGPGLEGPHPLLIKLALSSPGATAGLGSINKLRFSLMTRSLLFKLLEQLSIPNL